MTVAAVTFPAATPGVGHVPQLDAPQVFNEALRAAVQDMRER